MSAAIVAIAMALDAAFGEPEALWRRLPHPAVLMGRLIGAADRRLNSGSSRRLKGAALMLALCLGAWWTGHVIENLPFGAVFTILIGAILLAQKSLVQHVKAVATGLRTSLEAGRQSVAMIVGRDTSQMESPAVSRAAIESAAENLSDGVIAPVFWFLVAGLPGLLVYKITNTADSMIGYRTARHAEFGWAAARFDDLVNWIPARLTAVLIAVATGKITAWPKIRRDAPLHRSPNAGWPEAAMAIALDTSLSGPRSYDGKMSDFPWVWPEGRRNAGPKDIDASVKILWRVWGLSLGLVLVMTLL